MGNPFDQFDTPKQSANPFDKFDVKAPDRQRGMQDEFFNGLLMNFGDEAAAAIRAAIGPDILNRYRDLDKKFGLAGRDAPSTAPTFGERYDQELASGRASNKAFAAENPGLSTASNIAGNVVGTSALLSALPAGLTSMGPSLIANSAKLAGTGALLGGTAGFGAGEGGFDERVGSAILPAVLGGALGGATPIAGKAAQSVMESAPGRAVTERVVSPLLRKLSGAPPQSLSAAAPDGGSGAGNFLAPLAEKTKNVAQTGAIDRLATALQRSKLDPARVGSRLDDLGEGAMLADVDNQFARMARSSRSMPGNTSSHADIVLDARQQQMPGMVRRAFEGAEPPPSRYDLMGERKGFDSYRQAVGSRVYDAMDQAGLKQSPELMALYENPVVNRAIDKVMSAEKTTRVGTTRAAASPVDIMHKVKQEIQDMGVAATGRGDSTQSYYRDLAGEYVRALKSANPKLAEADTAYAAAASLPERFEAGHKFLAGGTSEAGMTSSAPALADALMNADPLQRLATRAGSTNAVREMTGGLGGLSGTRRIAAGLPNAEIAPKIEQLYGPQAREIQRVGDAVRTFDKTDKFVRGGSQTADKALEVIEDASNIGVRGGSGGVTARVWENVEKLAQRLLGPNEAVRDEIGRAMLNPNSAESRRILALAAELLKKRAAGSPIQAGLIEGTASQAGGP
jgi:hypothetical protein